MDIKTNEDFNNEHPDHNESGLINANSSQEAKHYNNKIKPTPDMKMTEDKIENKGAVQSYTCSMHPEVISDKPGKCPKCGMNLIEKKMN